jgi:RimJ/RimL family protein N-acetyltransferase
MNSALSNVIIRPWTIRDVDFSLTVRNNPELMKWFRQSKPIHYEDQTRFIAYDISDNGDYNGRIIESDGIPVGMCGVKDSGEFTIAVLPEFHHKGIARAAMLGMISQGRIWSEVFVGNPALEWFIKNFDFKIVNVKERAYYKPELGLVDVVEILRHE